MKRMGYRRTLPLVAFGTYAALIWFGCPYIRLAGESAHAAPRGEGTLGWNPSCMDFVPPAAEQLAYGLNAPAMVAAPLFDPLINRMHPTCRQSEYFDHAVIGLFVPFLWYFIGRLADNGDSARFRSCIRAHKVWACLGVFVLSAFATLIGASFFLTSPLDYLVLRVCMLGWIGLGVFTLLAGMRGGRATALPA